MLHLWKELQNLASLLMDAFHDSSRRKDIYRAADIGLYHCVLTLALAMNLFKQYTVPCPLSLEIDMFLLYALPLVSPAPWTTKLSPELCT